MKFSILSKMFVLFCLLISSFAIAQAEVTFHNQTNASISVLYYKNSYDEVLEKATKIIVLPKQKSKQTIETFNHFASQFVEIEGKFYHIYATKGDKISMNIAPKNKVTYEGKKSEVNSFLNEALGKLTIRNLYDNQKNTRCNSAKICEEKLEQIIKPSLDSLQILKTKKKITEQDYVFAKNAIELPWIQTTVRHGNFSITNTSYTEQQQFRENVLQRITIFDSIFLEQDGFYYYRVLHDYCKLISDKKVQGTRNEIGLFTKDLDILNFAPTQAQKKYAIYHLLLQLRYSYSDKKTTNFLYDNLLKAFPADIEVLKLKPYVAESLAKVKTAIVENYTILTYAPNGTFTEKTQTLGSVPLFLNYFITENTYILADVWASWCAVCIKDFLDIPNAKQLLTDQKTEILYINVDQKQDLEKAKQLIIQHKLYGKHFFLQNAPNIEWKTLLNINYEALLLPKRILLDKKANILHATMPKYSELQAINFVIQHK